MRFAFLAILLSATLAPLAAQDEEATRKRILEKVQKYLDEHFKQLEENVRKIVEEELAAAKPQGDQVRPTGNIEDAVRRINQKELRAIIEYLASDELEGRCAGYPGNDKATEFIAKIYEKAGLKPVGDKDEESGKQTYFQHFQVAGRKTRNTVALLEGCDPKLRSEIIVIGGHHDHLGKGKQGPAMQRLSGKEGDDDIWNGADDNASGSGTVVTIAKAFGEAGLKPRRSILFMTFSGEEWGLLGSQHYVSEPIFPLENTVTMINLDMVGRNGKRPVGIYGLGTEAGELFEKATESAIQRTGLNAKLNPGASMFGGDSDHTSFRLRRIPVMFFFTGIHTDYHTVRDHAEKLDWENIEKIGRTAAYILWDLANGDERPRFSRGKVPRQEFPPEEPPQSRPRRLGIMPDYNVTEDDLDELGLGQGQGALRVQEVTDGTVADKAGLEAGDWIVKFDGKTFPRGNEEALKELKRYLGQVKPNTDVEIEIIRKGKRKLLKARWDE